MGRRIRGLLALFVVVLASGCTPLQLMRASIDPTSSQGQVLLSLPDYQPGNCVWFQTGLQARSVKLDAISNATFFGRRESDCCPFKAGGDLVDGTCKPTGKKGAWAYDPTDSGVMQFNGFYPAGGTKPQSPARMFCTEGVRRFLNEKWTNTVTYVCDQKLVLNDPELQLDMLVMMLQKCGFGPWKPVNGQYGCYRYDPFT